MRELLSFALVVVVACTSTAPAPSRPRASTDEWTAYGGDNSGTRYSALTQIQRGNVRDLQLAWIYRTAESGDGAAAKQKLTFEATPLFVDGTLYFPTAFAKVIALDPLTGRERWVFDPKVDRSKRYSELASRGVAYWKSSTGADGKCSRRIFAATIDARLFALDARSGELCAGFGTGGFVDLASELGLRTTEEYVDYQVTSAPTVVNDVVVVGSSIGDNWNVDTGRGVVRGFNARSGAKLWSWDPIPYQKGRVGAANAWSPMSADESRDLVFVGTGSPSPDFWGGFRPGQNRDANSVVALRATTGQKIWSFQTVHHDLWDYDIAAQPALVSLRRKGRSVPAVAQATKMGSVFLLHRETGAPVFPVQERKVPQTSVADDPGSATQPFPTLPAALMPQTGLTPEQAWGPTEADRVACRELLERYPAGPIFTPPSTAGMVAYPGNASGTNWGSAAFDPERQLLVLNTSRVATFVQLIPRDEFTKKREQEKKLGGMEFEYSSQRGAPYGVRRATLKSPSGAPCNPPPWGTIAAVDLATGKIRWEEPLGRYGELRGVPNGGGPMITAGGLIFIAATSDKKFRALDIDSGAELWSFDLPYAGIATPMTFRANDGMQYVVTAAGGHGKMGLPTGDAVLAFRLPR